MSGVLFAPRVATPDSTRVPVRPPGYRPSLAFGLLALVAAVLSSLALTPSAVGFRLLMAGLALIVLAALVVAVAWSRAVPIGSVRVDVGVPGLRFVPPRALPISVATLAGVAVVVAAASLVLGAIGLPAGDGTGPTRFGPVVLALAATAGATYLVAGLRIPRGLTVTPDGVRGVRGVGALDLAWDDLDTVDIVEVRGARVRFRARDGRVMTIDPHWTGSDPHILAALVAHFHANPGDRDALHDARQAIERAERGAGGLSPRA